MWRKLGGEEADVLNCVEMAADRTACDSSPSSCGRSTRNSRSTTQKVRVPLLLADCQPPLSELTYPVVSRVAVDDRRLRGVCAKQARRRRLAATAASVHGERCEKTDELVEYSTCRSGEEGCCIATCAISLVIDLIGSSRRPSTTPRLQFEGETQGSWWVADREC